MLQDIQLWMPMHGQNMHTHIWLGRKGCRSTLRILANVAPKRGLSG